MLSVTATFANNFMEKNNFLQNLFKSAFSGATVAAASPAGAMADNRATPMPSQNNSPVQIGKPISYTLRDGTKVNTTLRDINGKSIVDTPPIFKNLVTETETKYPASKGLIAPIMMQESSWGQLGKGKDFDQAGKNGYMASLSAKTLKEMGIPFDNSATSTIRALGQFLQNKSVLKNADGSVRTSYTDPKQLYMERYWGNTPNSRDARGKKIYKSQAEYDFMKKKISDDLDRLIQAYN